MQAGEQPVAAGVAGEDPAGAVAALRRRGEPDDQDPRGRRAPARRSAGPSRAGRRTTPASRGRRPRASGPAAGRPRHTDTRASSSARSSVVRAAGVRRRGVPRRTGRRPRSPGRPATPCPGGTGEANGSPGHRVRRSVAHAERPGDALEDVGLGDGERRDLGPGQDPLDDHEAGVDHVGAAGVQVGQRAPLLDGAATTSCAIASRTSPRSCDRAVDRVRAGRPAGRGRRPRAWCRCRRCRRRVAASASGTPQPSSAASTSRAIAASSASVGGSWRTCRSCSRTEPTSIDRAARTPSRSPRTTSVEPPPTSTTSTGGRGCVGQPAHRPGEGQRRLLVAAQHLRRDPQPLPDAVGEDRAVGGVAGGRGGAEPDPLGRYAVVRGGARRSRRPRRTPAPAPRRPAARSRSTPCPSRTIRDSRTSDVEPVAARTSRPAA